MRGATVTRVTLRGARKGGARGVLAERACSGTCDASRREVVAWLAAVDAQKQVRAACPRMVAFFCWKRAKGAWLLALCGAPCFPRGGVVWGAQAMSCAEEVLRLALWHRVPTAQAGKCKNYLQ